MGFNNHKDWKQILHTSVFLTRDSDPHNIIMIRIRVFIVLSQMSANDGCSLLLGINWVLWQMLPIIRLQLILIQCQ